MSPTRNVLTSLRWRRLNSLDRVALIFGLLFLAALTARAFGWASALFGILRFAFVIALALALLARGLVWSRRHLMWSLRNRLLVVYLFIAVVPILVLVLMAWWSARFVYVQIGAFMVYQEIEQRLSRLDSLASEVATLVESAEAAATPEAQRSAAREIEILLASARAKLPGLEWRRGGYRALLEAGSRPDRTHFLGFVQEEEEIRMVAVHQKKGPGGTFLVSLDLPVTEELVGTMAGDLGPVRFSITRPAREGDAPERVTEFEALRFVPLRQIAPKALQVPEPAYALDFAVDGYSIFKTRRPTASARDENQPVLFVSVSTRFSAINRRLFTAPGEIGQGNVRLLTFIGVVFLTIQVAALYTGLRLSRNITHAVDELYRATQSVQQGDFGARVRVQQGDQLGALGDSFNTMTDSITSLIEEQSKRQRLENELSIAREVQDQLFPRSIPVIPGVELAAYCRAARVVSGDYYDFVMLGPDQLALVIADISGKGISAALLMASLQAALRSQLLLGDDLFERPAEVVSRLNRHLYLNTSDDRYATLFYAHFDAGKRTLRYVTAGHLPPFYIDAKGPRKLEEGGTVVGLLDDIVYEQGFIEVTPGSILVTFSDGLSEPENVYGEQFGLRRLMEESVRNRAASAQRQAELLIQAAEQWGDSPEQADDMTVIVAKFV